MSGCAITVGDCLDVFGALAPGSLDAIVTDPPAGVAFMGRAWDRDRGGRTAWIAYWAERLAVARRATKVGGWAVVWALPRTCGWTQMAIEDAGWFVTDTIHHVFGQGWPKGRAQLKPSHEVWFLCRNGGGAELQIDASRVPRGDPVPLFAEQCGPARIYRDRGDQRQKATGEYSTVGSWPANTILSHSPLCEPAGVRQVRGERPRIITSGGLGYGGGTGAVTHSVGGNSDGTETTPAHNCHAVCLACGSSALAPQGGPAPRCDCGRAMAWSCPVAEVDAQSGDCPSATNVNPTHGGMPWGKGSGIMQFEGGAPYAGERGGASRFFHCFPGDHLAYHSKAPPGERDAGCEDLYWRRNGDNPFGFDRVTREEWEAVGGDNSWHGGNVHPTVKGIDLMSRLVALVCPPGGTVGDLCTGSGGTALAAQRLGLRFVGAEQCPEAVAIAEARLAWWGARIARQERLFGEAEVILPEAKKRAREKEARVETPAPPKDPRQGSLFG